MDALLIVPVLALSFTTTIFVGKGLLWTVITTMERTAKSAQLAR